MRTARIKQGYGMIQRDIMTSDINVYSKAVYCLLVSYAGQKEYCYPSLNTMIKNLGISKPTIIKSLKELIKEGLIVADKRQTSKGEHANNVYYPYYLVDEFQEVVNDVYHVGNDNHHVVNDIDPKNNIKEESLFNNNELQKRVIFKIPNFEDVKEYFRLLKKEECAKRFFDHFTSNGWMVGRTKMKDWKAAVRSWIAKNEEDSKKDKKGSAGKQKQINGVGDLIENFNDI